MDSKKLDDKLLGLLIGYHLRRRSAVGHVDETFIRRMLMDYKDLKKEAYGSKVLIKLYKDSVLEKVGAINHFSKLIKESNSLSDQQEYLRQVLILQDELEELLDG